ncbi:MAG: ATPase, BadF/BadG/BcrA/BcrD type [Acidobacteriaceae bacterium]|nr:ATPase, BadF/BadG/BcrA/BcrD type [Acidobacteriaceae bacterium]
MPFFLGIDGGGTKTRCILGDEKSQLGVGSSSSSKVQRVGEACARDALAAAVHEACVRAGISPRQIARTCAGITGSARPEIARVMRDLMTSIVGGQVEIVGDVEIAFEDAFGSGYGVVVIAGTGSIAYGRNSKGEIARAGGWGYAVSDEGSGHWIGGEAVRAALRARDRGEHSGLLDDLMAGLGARDFEDFIVRLNESRAVDFAPLFPVVLAASDNGDSVANEILKHAGQELAGLAGIVIERLFGQQSISVATHGGVLASSTVVKKYFLQELKSRHPQADGFEREVDPARGALERARREFKAASA